jgi:hypothetical protein
MPMPPLDEYQHQLIQSGSHSQTGGVLDRGESNRLAGRPHRGHGLGCGMGKLSWALAKVN